MPQPGTGEIHKDPLFEDYANNDFDIAENSPCRGTGENGKDMGGRPYAAAVEASSWGRVKALFN